MVTKKIAAHGRCRGVTYQRVTRVKALVAYMLNPEKDSSEKAYMVNYMLRNGLGDTAAERLVHAGTRNLFARTMEGRKLELMALANAARRSPSPVDHWLLSFQRGESPPMKDIEEAVGVFLDHLGLGQQPCIFVVHGDTDNLHVHIAVSRYESEKDRMIAVNGYFYKEAAHQAVAIVVDRFKWKQEPNQRYQIESGKPVLSEKARIDKESGTKPIRGGAAASELRTGYKSAQRIAQETALPIMIAAGSWDELHRRLATEGLTYDLAGSNGAVIGVRGEMVRSSYVHRGLTPTSLEKRLGPFRERHKLMKTLPRDGERNRFEDALRADEYGKLRQPHEAWLAAERNRKALHREAMKRELTIRERVRLVALEQQRRSKSKPPIPPPNFESWLYSRNEGVLADRWRNRLNVDPLPSFSGGSRMNVQPSQIDAYHPFAIANGIRYAKSAKGPTAFLDRGNRIDVIDNRDDEAIIAALRLANLAFDGKVTVRGSAEFRARVCELALANGLAACLVDAGLVARQRAFSVPAGVKVIASQSGLRTEAPSVSDMQDVGARATQVALPCDREVSRAAIAMDERTAPARGESGGPTDAAETGTRDELFDSILRKPVREDVPNGARKDDGGAVIEPRDSGMQMPLGPDHVIGASKVTDSQDKRKTTDVQAGREAIAPAEPSKGPPPLVRSKGPPPLVRAKGPDKRGPTGPERSTGRGR